MTELSVPGRAGWAVASEVRRRWPEIQIVLVKRYAGKDKRFEGNRRLVNEMSSKPIRIEELSPKIHQVVIQK